MICGVARIKRLKDIRRLRRSKGDRAPARGAPPGRRGAGRRSRPGDGPGDPRASRLAGQGGSCSARHPGIEPLEVAAELLDGAHRRRLAARPPRRRPPPPPRRRGPAGRPGRPLPLSGGPAGPRQPRRPRPRRRGRRRRRHSPSPRARVHPNHPRALRASAGSLLRLPVAVGVEAERPRPPPRPGRAALGRPGPPRRRPASID